jgi:tRNA A37 methylthiotransferase MiaB
LHIDYTIFRWHEGEDDILLEFIENEQVTHVFINAIMGSVLALTEPIGKLIKEAYPSVEIWVGGIATLYVKALLSASAYVDHVSLGHPRANPRAFAEELATRGVLPSVPDDDFSFPPLEVNRHLDMFIHQHVKGDGTVNTINIASSSGCHHRCSFCYLARAAEWYQSPEDVVADMAMLQEKYDVRYFEFADDNFPSNLARVKEIFQRVSNAGLDFSFFCLTSVDVLTPEMLDMMIAGGLKKLHIGVDAFHADRIRQLNKNYDTASVTRVIEMVRSYPIDLTLALILGSYGETREQVQALYDWVSSIKPEICSPAFLTPYPNTSTYRQAIRRGFVPPDTLQGWAKVSKFGTPKPLNPMIDANEYREWKQRFLALSTWEFRSEIGDSARRIPEQETQDFPIGVGKHGNVYAK